MTPPDIGQSGTMAEILQAYPNAKIALFIRYHIGGCASCSYQLSDTLAEVCRNYSIADPLEAVLAFIRQSASVEAKIHISQEELAGAIERGDDLRLLGCAISRGMAGRPDPGGAACHGGIDLRGARFLA